MHARKRFLALVLVVLMLVTMFPATVLASRPQWHPDYEMGLQPELVGIARQAATEGIVMLENDMREDGSRPVLPLDAGANVAIFGRHQIDYFFVGYGSGGDVRFPYSTNLLQAMRRHPGVNVNENLVDVYEAWIAQYPSWNPDVGAWAQWPRSHPEMPLTAAQASAAAAESDVAIVVIGRSAGEDRDTVLNRRNMNSHGNSPPHYGTGEQREGSWYLTGVEVTMLQHVTNAFDDVVVLLNTGNIIDMTWLDADVSWVDDVHDCATDGFLGGSPNNVERCVPGNCVYLRYSNINHESIRSVLYVWQGGMDAGTAVVDILTGDANPSGRMHVTIPRSIIEHPATTQAGNANNGNFGNYIEDVFVGYRYFETFNWPAVRYPFGFGLSYTEFDIDVVSTNFISRPGGNVVGHYGWPTDSHQIELVIDVENTGTSAGKQVVQVYHSSPQSALAKPARELIAYAKTNHLLPGQTERLTIRFDVNQMASFADFQLPGTNIAHAWVMEAGAYNIFVGTCVASTRTGREHGTPVFTHTEPTTRIVNQLSEALAVDPNVPGAPFDRFVVALDASDNPIPGTDGPYTLALAPVPLRSFSLRDRIVDDLADPDGWARARPYRRIGAGFYQTPMPREEIRPLVDVYTDPTFSLEDFMAQMTVRELVELTRGGGPMGHQPGVPGNAGVFGGHARRLWNDFGIPYITALDGPSGLRMEQLADATLLPMATMLACTWNDQLVEDLYAALGREMLRNGADVLLAPGMDTQRTPINGRNFEYFSEDALLNGNMGANAVRGVHSEGVATSPKHFTANNQEQNRYRHNANASARALREIYISGYENIIKTGNLQATMSSYALINGIYSPMNYELNHIVLREQLGFGGLVMTDWWLRGDPRAFSPEFDPVRSGGMAHIPTAPDLPPLPTSIHPALQGTEDNPISPGAVGSWNTGAAGLGRFPLGPHGLAEGLKRVPVTVPVTSGGGFTAGVAPPLRFGYNAYRLRGRVDLLMPGDQFWGAINGWADEGVAAGWIQTNPMYHYLQGTMQIGEVQASAYNILTFALRSARFRIDNDLPLYDYGADGAMTPLFSVEQPEQVLPALDGIYIGGSLVGGFTPEVRWYFEFARDITNLPAVTASAPAGVTVNVAPAVVSGGYTTVVITASRDGHSVRYTVHFSDAEDLPSRNPDGLARLTGIAVNGEELLQFHHTLRNYTVVLADAAAVAAAVVTATAEPGVDIAISRDGDVVRIRAVTDYQAASYWVTLNAMRPGDTGYGLQLTTTAGDFWGVPNDTPNLVWQDAPGAWTMTTRIRYDSLPHASFHQLGILLFDGTPGSNVSAMWRMESNHYVAGNPQIISFAARQSGSGTMTARGHITHANMNGTGAAGAAAWPGIAPLPPTDGYFYMRMTRDAAGVVSVFFSRDNVTWIGHGTTPASGVTGTVAQRTLNMAQPRVGIFVTSGGNTATQVTGIFDWVQFTDVTPGPAPVTDYFLTSTLNENIWSVMNPRPDQFGGLVPLTPAEVTVVDIAPAGTTLVRAVDRFHQSWSGGFVANQDPVPAAPQQALNMQTAGRTAIFNIDVEEAGYYFATMRYASNMGDVAFQPRFDMFLNLDADPTVRFAVGGTGGLGTGAGGAGHWVTTGREGGEPVFLPEGLNKMLVRSQGALNLNWIAFERAIDENMLQALVDYVEAGYDGADYSHASWTALQEALEEAIVLLEGASTWRERTDAYQAIREALENLEPPLDRAELAAVIAAAEALYEDLFAARTWAEMQAALAAARAVYDDPEATPAQIDRAAGDLRAAIAALERRAFETPISDRFDASFITPSGMKPNWTLGTANAAWIPSHFNYNPTRGTGFLELTTTETGDFQNPPNQIPNLVHQAAGGDWVATTRIEYDMLPYFNYHQIGMMVFDAQNPNAMVNWRLEANHWFYALNSDLGFPGGPNWWQNYLTPGPADPIVTLSHRQPGSTAAPVEPGSITYPTMNATNAIGQAAWPGAGPMPKTDGYFYLRMERVGDTFTVGFSRDGVTFINDAQITGRALGPDGNPPAITPLAPVTVPMVEPRIALYAIGGSSPLGAAHPNAPRSPITASFDWICFDEEVIDTSALEAAIAAARPLNEADFLPGTWGEFADALAHAEAVLADQQFGNVSQSDVNAAADRLVAAQAALRKPADFTALQAAVDATAPLRPGDHTPASWAALQAARTAAQAVLADSNATQQQVDDARDALLAAQAARVYVGNLQAAMNDAAAHLPGGYTPESWIDLAIALLDARGVLARADASQAEVDAAEADVRDALAALVPRADVSALRAAVDAAASHVEENYTPASWADFADALAAARATLVNPNANQAAVDAARAALEQAQAALVSVVDREDLNDVIAEAEERGPAFNYTPESWADLEDALAAAEAVRDNPHATQQDVDDAEAALRDAIDALVPSVFFPDTMNWARPYVLEAYGKGIILREHWCDVHDDYIFMPSEDATRAMVADFIWRTAGAQTPVGTGTQFTDVATGAWYADAVAWASENDIIRGRDNYDGTFRFAPNDTIERRELSTMLMRLARYFGVDTEILPPHIWPAFADHADIGWAEPYIRWNFAVELLRGDNYNNVHPQRMTERAEAVTTVVRSARMFAN